MPLWDDFLTEQDEQVFAKAGYGARAGYGRRPLVLVVDVTYGFCGDRPEPILRSVERWRNSCGEVAWEAIGAIQRLLSAARAKRLPVFYTTMATPRPDGFDRGRWLDKNARGVEDTRPSRAGEIVAEIAPRPEDVVIEKSKPSAFFGTLLAPYLTDLGADSVITCGTTTSGCVRATVVDGFSYNFRMSVIEEATFDRGQASHAINLFDMHQKYADVVPLADVLGYLDGLPDDLFVDRMPSLARAPRLSAS